MTKSSLYKIKSCIILAMAISLSTFTSRSMTDYSGIRFYVHDQEKAALYVKLFQAVAEGRLEDLQKLIADNNIKIQDVRGDMDSTLLHEAVWKGQEKIVRFLLSLGADVTARNKKYNTPIHYAAQGDSIAIMELLLNAKDGDTEVGGWLGTHPLHWAAMRGKTTMVKYLIERGAKVNSKNSDGDTPLTRAIAERHTAVVKELLAAGAETPLQNYQFRGPATIAMDADCHDKEIVDLIKQYMSADKDLQAKLADRCCICIEELTEPLPENEYGCLHELTCCKKIAHHKCIQDAFLRKKLCPLCRRNPEGLLVDTTAPHMLPNHDF